MKTHQIFTLTTVFLSTLMLALLLSSRAMAHCDSMDGPVVKDAQRALSGKNVDPVLKWVDKEDEESIRKAFDMTGGQQNYSPASRASAEDVSLFFASRAPLAPAAASLRIPERVASGAVTESRGTWNSAVQKITYLSSADNTRQPMMFYKPQTDPCHFGTQIRPRNAEILCSTGRNWDYS